MNTDLLYQTGMSDEYSKDFDGWNTTKKRLELRKDIPLFKEREIWWCSVGMNIGFETFGKGADFNRPVLILNKHNRYTFFGLPLGSARNPDSAHHFSLDFGGRNGSVFITQGRTLSSKRLTNRMGALPEHVFNDILEAFQKSFNK